MNDESQEMRRMYERKKGKPKDVYDKTLQSEMFKEFCALPREEKLKLLAIATRRAKMKACFMCKWIVDKKHLEDFPREARIAHLMLDCKPINDEEEKIQRS